MSAHSHILLTVGVNLDLDYDSVHMSNGCTGLGYIPTPFFSAKNGVAGATCGTRPGPPTKILGLHFRLSCLHRRLLWSVRCLSDIFQRDCFADESQINRRFRVQEV